jgi:hypothetical protein
LPIAVVVVVVVFAAVDVGFCMSSSAHEIMSPLVAKLATSGDDSDIISIIL